MAGFVLAAGSINANQVQSMAKWQTATLHTLVFDLQFSPLIFSFTGSRLKFHIYRYIMRYTLLLALQESSTT